MYRKSKQKAEVDFIVSAEGLKVLPIEVKSGAKKQEIPRPLRSFIQTYSPAKTVVLNRGRAEEQKIGDTRVFFLPFWLIR